MSWLLDLLVDAIKEMVSQFLVDMMGLITDVFTDLLSCNLSLFEELFSVVGSLYQNVIVPMGIALLLMILIWQLFKSMFGKVGINAEEPIELIGRSSICLFFVVASKPVINYILKIAGTPYQWVIGTDIKVQSFSEYVTALEGITAPLGLGTVSIAILMLIMQFVVAWNYFKMLFIIAERYVLLGVFSYTAPLAFATGGSKSTNNILASWSKMFGGQVVLIILNAWCLKMFLSGYGNMMASGYGFTKFFVATLCLVGFCKITFKLDSYMAALGVNLGRPSPGMGALGAAMAAQRIFSQAGRAFSGTDGSGNGTGRSTNMGNTDPTNGFTGPAGPIPMNPSGGNEVDIESLFWGGDFDTEYPEKHGNAAGSVKSVNHSNTASANVLDELGIHANGTESSGTSYVSGTAATAVTSASEIEPGMESDDFVEPEGTVMDLNTGSLPEYQEASGREAVSSEGVTTNETMEDGFSETLSSVNGLGEMENPGEPDFPDGKTTARSDPMSFEEQPFEGASAFNSDNGIMAELGEYPASETGMGTSDYAMEMDLGGGIGNKSQEADRNTSSEEKGELSYSASGFESDVSGSLNGRYSGSDENVAGENGDFFASSADLGILDAVSGNESVHANPEMDVNGANSFSEEAGNVSGNMSDVPQMETPIYSNSGISGNIESEKQLTNMGEPFAQEAEAGGYGNYSTTGNSAVDSFTGTNESEDSFIQKPDEYLEQDNLDPIEEANDSFTLPEEINGMEEIQTEDAQMPMNMELLRNPHRIREIPKSRSELRGQKQGDRDTGRVED